MELYLILVVFLLLLIWGMMASKFGKLNSKVDELKKELEFLIKIQDRYLSEKMKRNEQPVDVAEKVVAVQPVVEVPEPERVQLIDIIESEPVVVQEMFEEDVVDKEEIVAADAGIENQESLVAETTPFVMEPAVVVNRKEKKPINYEKYIGENLFGKIGILVLVVGIGLFVKYAIDQNWINETLRTILGFVAGSALLFVAERLRDKYRTFSSLLAGGAFAVFYITVAIAYHYYHLFSQPVAFIVLIIITLLMSVLAILYDRRELAVISLIGGFIAPFLVSSGEGNYVVLFTYITILNLGMFGLSLYKKWSELPVISFGFTYLILLIYVVNEFIFGSVTDPNMDLVAGHLLVFATLFYIIFLLPVISILKSDSKKISRILLSVIVANNFIYLGFGLLFLNNMLIPFKVQGLLTLFVAIVNLGLVVWLKKSDRDFRFLVYTILGLVLTFVSITVPVQLDGNYITLFWASEMVLLLWLYVKSKIRLYEYASLILVALTTISFLMDIENQIEYYNNTDTIFLNSMFATFLFTGLAAGVYALLMSRYREFFTTARFLKYTPWNAIMLISSVVILYYTFMIEFYLHLEEVMAEKVMLLFTTGSILLLSYAFRKRFPISECRMPYITGIGISTLLYIMDVWKEDNQYSTALPYILSWIITGAVIVNLYYVGRKYYTCYGCTPQSTRFTVYLNVIATLFWLAIVNRFLGQLNLADEFNAGFSVALAIAGLVQMSLGMRLHQKILRIISLVTFGIVLVKLTLVDLWAMPTVGKIIVFIILGVILLLLSFLYQKLKDVLFKDDNDEAN